MSAATASISCADSMVIADKASAPVAVCSSEPGALVGRVIQDGRLLRAMTDQGPFLVEARRRGSRGLQGDDPRPLCGDWVLIEPYQGNRSDTARGRIRRVLPRRNVIERSHEAGGPPQPMLANVDEGWIVCGLDRDPRLRQLPRYLAILRAAQLDVLVVLNKIDRVPSMAQMTSVASAQSTALESVAVSANAGIGLSALTPRLIPGRVIALFGASGAGKSSLVNALMGSDFVRTGSVRTADARGRHTTSGSSLWETPQGAMLIDTPGSRELGIVGCDLGVSKTFQSLEARARDCRFSDCRHEREPGCAVRIAIERGELSAQEFLAYLELRQEGDRADRLRRRKRA